jgi:hypothetical protein
MLLTEPILKPASLLLPPRPGDLFIPHNVISSKNSKQWTGHRLIKSKAALRYEKETADYWGWYRSTFLRELKGRGKPYRIGFYFVRATRQKFDYVNMAQLPLDLMQTHGWLEDDDADHVVPVFLGYETGTKKTAGLIIRVL